jgi:hypothetical protein
MAVRGSSLHISVVLGHRSRRTPRKSTFGTSARAREEIDEGQSRSHLQRLTEKLSGFLFELSDVITHKYLTHTAASRQLSATFAVPAS